MSSINKVMVLGRLGADPKASGPATKLSIATNEKYKDKNGVYVDKTEWHHVTMFGRLAEIAMQYLKKGSIVYVEGKMQTTKWQDKTTGADRYTTEIIANEMKMIGGKNNDGMKEDVPSNLPGSMFGVAPEKMKPLANFSKEEIDDDLPF